MAQRPPSPEVPAFLALASHPVRWRLLVELAASDRQVVELTRLSGEPQNLVSYHLAHLRSGGLVSSRRSSFDRRVSYYRIDLERCSELLAETGGALHPGLVTGAVPSPVSERVAPATAVLFLCTGNGARSQIAEALLRARLGDAVDVASAGSHPKPIHPNAIAVLAERGIDIASARSKSMIEYEGRRFDTVVTLCDKVREICPEFPGGGRAVHWSIDDPSAATGSNRVTLPVFRAIADELGARIEFLARRLETESGGASTAQSPRTTKEQSHHGRRSRQRPLPRR